MGPLRGTNKATWCAKLLPMTVYVYQVNCGSLCALLRTQCCCLPHCGWYCPPLASHPPPSHPPSRPPTPINFIHDITAVDKNHLKNQQSQLDGEIYLQIHSYISRLPILCVWRGYTVAQVNHSGLNISNWYFSKYKMCPLGQFSQIQSHMSF